ncbi:hypothetical protein ILUMI_04713 [Ignelater luminosus]|uniref:Uncharacterized protein n=1 Tax=Ignelater luminosus TaxID=2038154 RepID=A0A8K0D8F6_IGNLU|nr:hypothetical protein ILUMI_04713 [Ignelater luminosus]
MPRLPGQTESTLENRGKIRSMWENDVSKAAIVYRINSSTFCSSEDNLKVLWRLDNTRYDPRHVQPTRRSRRITCGYWGWMSSHGPGELVSVSQLFSSEEYVVILEDVLPPTVNVVMSLYEKEQEHLRRLLQGLDNEEEQHNKGLLSYTQDPNPDVESEDEIDSEERQEENSDSEQDISDSE